MTYHDHLGSVKLGVVDIELMSVCLLLAYAENFVKIHQGLVKI